LIIGCGIDLVKIDRIEKIVKKWGNNFIFRIFTSLEREYCNVVSAKGVSKYFISISHTKEYAVAQVILEGTLDK
jgi:phosphopantetheinyl transferase (holo-ACP synthase)